MSWPQPQTVSTERGGRDRYVSIDIVGGQKWRGATSTVQQGACLMPGAARESRGLTHGVSRGVQFLDLSSNKLYTAASTTNNNVPKIFLEAGLGPPPALKKISKNCDRKIVVVQYCCSSKRPRVCCCCELGNCESTMHESHLKPLRDA